MLRFSTLTYLTLLLSASWIGVVQGQVKLDRFFPPVVARGSDANFVGEGKFPEWPVKVACDRKDIQIAPQKDSGKFLVAVGKNAPPGVTWIRVYDGTSASNLTPILITSATTTAEAEPNNKNSDATRLSLPTTAFGKLEKGGEVDSYRVSLGAGQRLVASVTANQVLGSPMDAVLQLTDLSGNIILQSEDVRGLDPQIAYLAESKCELLLRLFAFPEVPTGTIDFAGSAAFVYTIDVTTGPFVDHAIIDTEGNVVPIGINLVANAKATHTDATKYSPDMVSVDGAMGWAWSPNLVPTAATPITSKGTASELPAFSMGHIASAGQIETFRFDAQKGKKYRIESWSKKAGFLMDSELTLLDTKSNAPLASNDDQSRGKYDSVLDYTAKEDQNLTVSLRDLVDGFGRRHLYQLSIREFVPEAQLTVSTDHFSVEKDKPLEVSVNVVRDRGFNSRIRISATDLPDGVHCDAVVSEPKGETAKQVKLSLKNTNAKPTHRDFSIVGETVDQDNQPTGTKFKASFALRPVINIDSFWLTCHP